MQHFSTGAQRDDDRGKLDWTLLPTEAMRRVIRHLMTGAEHYGRCNFQKGIPVSRCTQSMMRHAVAFMEGKADEDHLAAIVVNGLFILHMQEVHGDNPEINDDPRGLGVEDHEVRIGMTKDEAFARLAGHKPVKTGESPEQALSEMLERKASGGVGFACRRCGRKWHVFTICPVCQNEGATNEA